MIYARLDGNRIVELIPVELEMDGRAVPVQERYHPDFVAALVLVDTDVLPGCVWDGVAFAPPPAPPPPTEAEARAQRDQLLSASDWTQLPDAPVSAEQRLAWSSYRAALRLVPDQPGFPAAIAWPAAPA